eukprot:8210414-Alexandrium_andersonii.AAC.1
MDERIRLARESRDAVRHTWRGGRTVHPPTADPRNPAEWGGLGDPSRGGGSVRLRVHKRLA